MGERRPESEINLLKKQQKNFDDEQKFQGDKGDQGGARVSTQKKLKTQKCHQKLKKRINGKPKKEYL
ncbi:hypothetical protein [Okeania sp. SIO2C9]|uniref:hypothetical protein n=1 Tax=Okeania sp. SIO2C9 TaxID=2607791 RepID=UPI0025F3890C|nr:hypothetical protein [Okeania sp. SIO2C9]